MARIPLGFAACILVSLPASAGSPLLPSLNGVVLAQAGDETLSIPLHGMTCASCAVGVKLALRKVEGVTSVKVTSDPQQALVTFDPARANARLFVKAIEELGYGTGTPTKVP